MVDPLLHRSVGDFVHATCRAITTARSVQQVLRLLQLLAATLLEVGATHDPFVDTLEDVDATRQALGEWIRGGLAGRRQLQQALYNSAFEELSDALLTVVAPDWLALFPDDIERQQLFYRWFDEAPALALLQSLGGHLSSVQPVGPQMSRRLVAPVSADTAAAVLAERFAAPGSAGIAELAHSCGASGGGAAALLAALPDRAAAVCDDAPLLQPGTFVPFVTQQLLCIIANEPSAVEFAGDTLGRFARRGHAVHVAATLCSALGAGQAEPGAAVLAGVRDSMAMEKVVEAVVRQLAPAQQDPSVAELAKLLPPSVWAERSDVRHLLSDKLLTQHTLPQRALDALLDYLRRASAVHSSDGAGERATAVAEGPSAGSALVLAEAAWHVAALWGDRPTIQRLPARRQAYLAAALVGCLRRLTRAEFERHPMLMPAVLQGISARLDSALPSVRRQGMRVGQAMSLLLSPAQAPLFGEEDLGPLPEEAWDGGSCAANPQPAAAAAGKGRGAAPREGSAGPRQRSARRSARVGGGDGALTETDSDDDASTDSEFERYDLEESDEEDVSKCELQLRDVVAALRRGEGAEWKGQLVAVRSAEALIRSAPDELPLYALPLARALLYAQLPRWADEERRSEGEEPVQAQRFRSIVAVVAQVPEECGVALASEFYSPSLDTHQRALLLEALCRAAGEVAAPGSFLKPLHGITGTAGGSALASGAAVSRPAGRVTRASIRSLAARQRPPPAAHANLFPCVALKWAAALVGECGVRRHGIDLFGRDHFLLGRLLVTLGSFLEAAANSPQAVTLSAAVVELIRGAGVHDNAEPYVRRAALMAASQVLMAVPPGRLASAMLAAGGGDAAAVQDSALAERLQWLMGWTADAAERDADDNCRTMAAACQGLQTRLAASALYATDPGIATAGDGGLLSLLHQAVGLDLSLPRVGDLRLP